MISYENSTDENLCRFNIGTYATIIIVMNASHEF